MNHLIGKCSMILRYQFRVIHRTIWSIRHGPRTVNLFEIVISKIPLPENTTISSFGPQNLVFRKYRTVHPAIWPWIVDCERASIYVLCKIDGLIRGFCTVGEILRCEHRSYLTGASVPCAEL